MKGRVACELREIASGRAGGYITATDIDQGLRGRANMAFGSWQNACDELGISYKRKPMKSNYTISNAKTQDVSQGIEVQEKCYEALCWRCAKSGGVTEERCSWDKELILPAGAEYVTHRGIEKKDQYELHRVVRCPEYKRWEHGRRED